ncbi:MAG: hypothetical protein COA79_05890 [Planctomycetota bacterium]|nr:MAG: hypothetical protein COA79_05890 [Planctomycetota bacterium]
MKNSNSTHFESGTDLGDYIIEKVIATGGMGDIYKAKEKSLGRNVVIKTIKHDLLNQIKIAERFQNEAKIIAQLNHPNIVIIHSFIQEEDFDYIVLEYIDGKTLQEVIEDGSISIDYAIELMEQILNGLKAAHDNDVLHRDIKPANIMLDKNKRIKILDFGLAKSIDLTHDSFTTAGTIMGTTYYLSPEVAVGKKPIKASDIYSTGIVFYELVTGELPFQADTPLGTIEKIKTEQLPTPEKINPQVPTFLSNIILKMCKKNPEERYLNIDEILSDLKSKSQIQSTIKSEPQIKIQTSQKISSMGFEEIEVDEILSIAKDLQEKKENQIGKSTIMSIGEELHIDEEVIKSAVRQFEKNNNKANNFFNDNIKGNLFENSNKQKNHPDDFEKAPIFSRGFALLIDFIILSFIGIGTFGIGMLFYVPICHHLFKGQTLGQKANDLITITTNGKKLSFEKSLIDSIGMIFLPFDILIGMFCNSNTKHFQRFMQTIAGTVIVKAK